MAVKFFAIRGNASRIICEIVETDTGITFQAIFRKREDAEKALKEVGDAAWHIEELEINV